MGEMGEEKKIGASAVEALCIFVILAMMLLMVLAVAVPLGLWLGIFDVHVFGEWFKVYPMIFWIFLWVVVGFLIGYVVVESLA